MSRSGYTDDCEFLELYRGTVERSIAGKRGQIFLAGLAEALDGMSEKKLISDELVNKKGEVCAIGSFCKAKGIDMDSIDYEDPEMVGRAVGISQSMAAEIEYENDDQYSSETPEQRWVRMRKWVDDNLKSSKS